MSDTQRERDLRLAAYVAAYVAKRIRSCGDDVRDDDELTALLDAFDAEQTK